MRENELPRLVVEKLIEHTGSFVVFYYDGDGRPHLALNAPTIKDLLALERLVMDYAQMGLPPAPHLLKDIQSEEDEDLDDEGGEDDEPWKRE